MKHISTKLLGLLLCLGLAGCDFKADVDLSNIDMTTSVATSLSLPVGSISANFGDFIGANSVQNITIDEQGRYLFMDTLHISRSYHPIDLSEYVTSASSTWKVADEIYQLKEQLTAIYPQLAYVDSIPLPFVIPAGTTFEIEFPIDLKPSNLNVDFNYQRVDSIVVDLAQFSSLYTLNGINLKWQDITNIQIILGENFKRAKGNTFDLPREGKDFGKPMSIEVDDFHLVLMKDPTAEPSSENIVDTVSVGIRFSIQTSEPLEITKDQYIGYEFELNFIDYSAMYGYFAASSLMRDELAERPLHELWDGWQVFDNWILPVSEPSVTFVVDHTLAVPMIVNLRHLYTQSKEGERRDATFDESNTQRSKHIHLPAQIAVTDPLNKHAYDTILLDYTAENGNIDTLLTIPPHSISYAFDVEADTTTDMKQFRITDNTNINLDAILHIPFAFNDSVHITYSDTIYDVDLTQLQLDSLLQQAALIDTLEDSELQLYVVVENSIPFAISADFTFYNAHNEVVQLSTMDEPSFKIAIDNPNAVTDGIATESSRNHLALIRIKQEDFDTLASITHIVFDATLGDNYDSVKLTPDAAIRLQLGVTANIKAIIDLNEIL